MSKSTLFWRPISSAAPAAPQAPLPAISASYPNETAGELGRGRRRLVRRRRSTGNNAGQAPPLPSLPVDDGEEGSDEAARTSDDDRPVTDDVPRPPKPRRVIDRSVSIVRREEELGRALVVSVITEQQEDLSGPIAAAIARQFEMEEAVLTLRRFGPSSFLLILPSEEVAARVYNGGRPIIAPSFRLHVMYWTRFLHSRAATLPFAVEVELRGIPAHAWEMSTAEQLLDEFCWVCDSHPVSVTHRDVFRIAAWCSCPERIPAEMDLEIVEPLVAGNEMHRRTLTYPIEISVVPFDQPPATDGPAPPSPPANDDQGRRKKKRRHRRSRPATSPAQEVPGRATAADGAPRISVHDRLGPQVVRCGHVAEVPDMLLEHAPVSPRVASDEGADIDISEAPLPAAATTSSLAPEDEHADGPFPGAVPRAWPGITAGSSPQINASEVPRSASRDATPVCAINLVAAVRTQDVGIVSPGGPIYGVQPSARPILEASLESVQRKEEFQPLFEASTWSPTLERMWSSEPLQEQATPSRDTVSLPLVPDFDAEQGTSIVGLTASRQCPATPILKMPNASRTCTKVYSRRRVQVMVTTPVEISALEGINSNPSTSATLTPSSARRRSSFMAKITKKTARILPTPRVRRPRAQARTPSAPPRRSRRIVGVEPESPAGIATRNKKKVMRALHVIEENEGVRQEVLDDYGKFFAQPLPTSHVQALAALFGWAVPEDVNGES